MPLTPRKYVIVCPPECSYHPDKIGEGKADLLKDIKEAGHGQHVFRRKAEVILGFPVPAGNAQRHLRHYREATPDEPEPDPTAKVSDLSILDSIISAGAKNSRNWRPSIGDTLKAMEMKLRLTGNSAFEDMLDAMAAASGGEDDDEEEAPEAEEAVLAPGERADEDEEPLAEPLI